MTFCIGRRDARTCHSQWPGENTPLKQCSQSHHILILVLRKASIYTHALSQIALCEGATVVAGGNTEGSGDAVANATGGEDPMYSTNRVGPSFLYSFGPVNQLMPEETYNVTLFFNELYWSRAGQRLFNVSANNETRLINFDIFKSAGAMIAALQKMLMVIISF